MPTPTPSDVQSASGSSILSSADAYARRDAESNSQKEREEVRVRLNLRCVTAGASGVVAGTAALSLSSLGSPYGTSWRELSRQSVRNQLDGQSPPF